MFSRLLFFIFYLLSMVLPEIKNSLELQTNRSPDAKPSRKSSVMTLITSSVPYRCRFPSLCVWGFLCVCIQGVATSGA